MKSLEVLNPYTYFARTIEWLRTRYSFSFLAHRAVQSDRRRISLVERILMNLRFIVCTALIAIWSFGWVCPGSASYTMPPSFDVSEEDIKHLAVMIDATLRDAPSRGAGIICGVDKDSLYVVTADHVVRSGKDEAQEIQLQFKSLSGRRVKAMLLPQHDSELDLAVLRVDGLAELKINVESLPFERLGSPQSLKRGAEIYMLGYPGGRKWWINTSPERFAEREGDWIRYESRLITGGNSGGALLDANRDLVGMVRSDEPPNGEAISITSVIRKLREWRYPVALGELDSSPLSFSAVSAGPRSVCGVTTSGTAYCWGRIVTYHPLARDIYLEFRPRPERIRGGLTFKTISVGSYHACGLTTDGVAYCWGDNTAGRLGDGSEESRFDPVPVSGNLTFQSLSVSMRDTLALTADGKVYRWGQGYGGLEPRLMPETAGFVSVSSYRGFNSGISKSGVAYRLDYDRAPERHTTDVPLDSVGGNCSIGRNGAAYCWKYGSGSASNFKLVKVPTPDGAFFRSASGTYELSCALDKSGAIYCWDDAWGDESHHGFSKVPAPGGRAFRSVTAGIGFACGITVDSALYCWGRLARIGITEPGKDYGTVPLLITRK